MARLSAKAMSAAVSSSVPSRSNNTADGRSARQFADDASVGRSIFT
jgi:hypothetical protein